MALQQIFIGVGYAIGPTIGAALYEIGGYRLPFIVVGIFDCSLITLKWFAPRDTSLRVKAQSSPNWRSITSWDLLRIPRVNYAILSYFGASAILCNIESNMTIKLREAFDFSQTQIASSLLLLTGSYTLTLFLFLFLTFRLDKRYILVLSNFGQTLSVLLIGPSLLFDILDKEWVVLSGVALLGISTPSVFAFAIEETVAPSVGIYPGHYDRIANLASSLLETR